MESKNFIPQLLTGRKAAAWLGISPTLFYTLVGEGLLQRVKIGKRYRYHTKDLMAYIEKHRSPHPAIKILNRFGKVNTNVM